MIAKLVRLLHFTRLLVTKIMYLFSYEGIIKIFKNLLYFVKYGYLIATC